MSYTAPPGDAAGFSWVGIAADYATPDGDAAGVTWADLAAELRATASIAITGSGKLRIPGLAAAGTISVEAFADLSRPLVLRASGVITIAAQTKLRAGRAYNLAFEHTSGYTPPQGASTDFLLGDSSDDSPPQGLRTGINVSTGAGYREAPERNARVGCAYGPYRRPDMRRRLRTEPPSPISARAGFAWDPIPERSRRVAMPWSNTATTPQRSRAPAWHALDARDRRGAGTWDRSIGPRQAVSAMWWIVPGWIDRIWQARHDHVAPYRIEGDTPPVHVPAPGGSSDFGLNAGYDPPAWYTVDFNLRDAMPNPRIGPRASARTGRWNPQLTRRDAEDRIPWGPRGSRDATGIDIEYPQEPPEPPPEPPPLPPEKRVYLLMPSIECKRVSDDMPIVVNAATVRTDRESWCWECDLTLARREDRDAIKPTSSGPREIELKINGRKWRFLIERHRRTHSFKSGNSYSATGRSPSAELAAPYSAPRTFTTTQDRTANQAASDELENTGWSIVWDTEDWFIPEGGFSYQDLTPMQAIKRLAEAVGAVVITDPTEKTLYVEPRYKVSPWERDDEVADKALTEDVIFQLDGEWKPGPGYNAVYVAGRQGGVIVHVVRANTAQDTEAEMTVDDLIVERLAGRERGRQILAGAGDRERVPIKTPLLPDPEAPGLVLPGTLLEVNEEGETWRGQVESCEVSATRQNATTVRQQIEVDRYHG